MKAGRELDALVAERVMGLVPTDEHYRKGRFETLFYAKEDCGGGASFRTSPTYSTNLDDAITVAERSNIRFRPYENGWVAGKAGDLKSVDRASAKWLELNPMLKCAKTAAHAICLAALETANTRAPTDTGLQS